MCCPLSSCPLRLKIPMMQPCGPNNPRLRPPHPDSVFSAQMWKEASVQTGPRVPTRAQRQLHEPHTHAHLNVSAWPTPRAAAGHLTALPHPTPEGPSSWPADTASLSRHACSSYLRWEKRQLNTCFSSSKYANIYPLFIQDSLPCHLVLSLSNSVTVPEPHLLLYLDL